MKNIIVQIFLFAFVGILAFSCKPGDIPFTMDEYHREFKDQANDWGIPDEDTNFKYTYTTPRGQIIESVVPVPSEFLGYADEGSQRQADRFRVMFPLWTNGTEIAGRRIFIISPSRTYDPTTRQPGPYCENRETEPGSPCLYVGGIQAAATTFGLDDRWQKMDLNPPIVIPHQQFQNWRFVQYFKNSVEYENEHREGFLNKLIEPIGPFYYYQGPNDVHPWTWGEQQKGLVSRPQDRWFCLPQ